jgi:hypothetical protein
MTDRSVLREAVRGLHDGFWFLPSRIKEPLVAAARAVVEAPEAEYCKKHRSLRAPGLRNECTWGADARRSGFNDYEDCRMVVVYLVPAEKIDA